VGRLILDTGILIALDRRKLTFADIVNHGDDVTVSTVAVAEFLAGAHLSSTSEQRARHRAFISRILGSVPVDDYTLAVAEKHAELMAHVRRIGYPRGALDLVIAATALTTNRTLVTTDAKARFEELPGLSVRVV
jgi:tRNA(fMet)-specific endonuclease VapC